MPRPFLACYLREPLTLELGLQGNMEEVSVSGCEECACRRLAQSVRRGGGQGECAAPAGGAGSHPSAVRDSSLLPTQGEYTALPPHSGLQNPGKVYVLDRSPSLAGSTGPSLPCGSGQHLRRTAPPRLLGLRVEGLEAPRPRAPCPASSPPSALRAHSC